MDYCHPCRRHLNGALACPGCGTSAEACREYAASLSAPANAGARDGHDPAGGGGGEPSGGEGRRPRRGSRGVRA
ncbi:SCO2400 family protein, partial [Streptomyces beigongshangae]|uniref:SCO2400 family protein n=1 Tax=Streptomyces beigongshangae TaxID=2841597 RepID=UPI003D322937